MVFSPAWGGAIPLVPIGSFRGFLEARTSGKTVKIWFTTAASRGIITAASKTAVGRALTSALAVRLRGIGINVSPSTIGVELQGYIAFQKFQHQQAVKAGNLKKQRAIERTMALPRPIGQKTKLRRSTGTRTFPEQYFRHITPGKGGGGFKDRFAERESPGFKSMLSWFERRHRRRGRFVNV